MDNDGADSCIVADSTAQNVSAGTSAEPATSKHHEHLIDFCPPQEQERLDRQKKAVSVLSEGECTILSKEGGSCEVEQPKGWEACTTGTKSFFIRLGMSESALEGWTKLHVNPVVALWYFWASQAGLLVVLLTIIAGMKFDNSVHLYIITIPFIAAFMLQLIADVFFWRLGPDFAHHKMLSGIMITLVACSLPMLLFGYLGAREVVPWNSRIMFSGQTLLMFFFASQAAQAGANGGEHPIQPRTSITMPVVQGLMESILVWDALVDIGLIRSLNDLRRDGCWWFGEQGRCRPLMWLTVIFTTFAVLDFVISFSIFLLAGQAAAKNQRQARIQILLQMACLGCEVPLAACTLVHLFSLRASHKANGLDRLRVEKIFTIGALVSTVGALIVMVVGAANTQRALQHVWHTISTASVTGRRASKHSIAKVKPVEMSVL